MVLRKLSAINNYLYEYINIWYQFTGTVCLVSTIRLKHISNNGKIQHILSTEYMQHAITI